MKAIKLKSKTPLKLDSHVFAEALNKHRRDVHEKFSEEPYSGNPADVSDILKNTHVCKNRDELHGGIFLTLRYVDGSGTGCTRDFPNFGMEVVSESHLSLVDGVIFLDIDFTVKASKKKWEKAEISECAEALAGDVKFNLAYIESSTIDSLGYTLNLTALDETPESKWISFIPKEMFEIEFIQ